MPIGKGFSVVASVRCIPPLPRTAFSTSRVSNTSFEDTFVKPFLSKARRRSGEPAASCRYANEQGAGGVLTTHHDRRGPSNSRSGREGPSQPAVTCPTHTHPREPRRLHGPIGKARGNPGEVTHARACAHTHTRARRAHASTHTRTRTHANRRPRAARCPTANMKATLAHAHAHAHAQ